MSSPVRYTPAIETPLPDEAETIADINAAFDTILEKTSEDYGHAVRAVHAKAHAILEAEFVVDEGLPDELAQGLFAVPGAHRAWIRISTNAGDILPDAISLPRGIAIKVEDAEGARLAGAEGGAQDFILVNGPIFQAKTADKFLANLKLLAKTTDRLEGTKKVVSAALRGVHHAYAAVGLDAPAAVDTLGGAPNSEPLGETYYSATAFRFGDYIAKFSLAPLAPEMTALTGRTIDVAGREDAIREELRRELSAFDALWEFRVQLCHDLAKQPVEDASVEWDEEAFPFRRVALLRARVQDSWEASRRSHVDEAMRFSVWTGLEAHRPLGNINRARRDTYRHSADFRAAFNACPYHEPSRVTV
ncbi:MAG TPA: catalase family protein [Sphingopyxis sp.]|jgi:hypothetical protein|uniref:catalase family protein n=1 Tax=Sphingopyxis sp. TaxID=1908224 RepID=UPI002E15C976|nr:catalase family protein [Sphingopyxis sp.]